MSMRAKKNADGSEFRQDLVSGDWILVAAKRAKRPHRPQKRIRLDSSKKNCPFDDPQAGGDSYPLFWLPHPDTSHLGLAKRSGAGKLPRPRQMKRGGKTKNLFKYWWVQILPNKYPAL